MDDSGRSWRDLTRPPVHPATPQRTYESALCFLIDLDSGGSRPRVDPLSRVDSTSLVLATRSRERNAGTERVTPLGVVPRAPFPAGAAGVVCELMASTGSPIVALTREVCLELLPALAQAGVLYGARGAEPLSVQRLRPSRAEPWCVRLEAEPANADSSEPVEFSGRIQRTTPLGQETLAPTRIEALLDTGFVVAASELSLLEADSVAWLRSLRQGGLRVPRAELAEFLGALSALPGGPRVSNVEDVGFTLRAEKPQPLLRLALREGKERLLRGTLSFLYRKTAQPDSEAWELGCEMRAEALVDPEARLVLQRDYSEESAVVERLGALRFDVTVWEAGSPSCPFDVRVPLDDFLRSCEGLLEQGFRIELDGQLCRRARGFRAFVDSELDWFELKGNARFDQQALELPELLDCVRKRQRLIKLSDGTLGVLPEQWIIDFDPLAALVNPKRPMLRFHALSALLVDGVLGQWAPASDRSFEAMKARVREFSGVAPLGEPAGFRGELRGYQRVALGWLSALSGLGLGGCLADDMGLGKTVVVLAWLLLQKERAVEPRLPSLLVVPKSLLFNWRSEAERFTPGLKLLLHHGAGRTPPSAHFDEYDLVLASYGTLRRDIVALSGLRFDSVILDEAHTIKNEASQVHRAARRLSSRSRLALSGTPLENHLLELWSLLSFVNPRVFEQVEHLRRTFERARPSQVALREVVHKLVRPFVLRRTKAEVAPELPARIEKTLYVPLGGAQAVVYRQLAEHYRAQILDGRATRRYQGKNFGVSHHNGHEAARALEALLRLRQAACHPALLASAGMLDSPEARAATAEDAPNAKLDLLLDQLASLHVEGHKALVFSQFTGFLGLVRKALERRAIPFEYLDGQTQRREEVVQRFQSRSDACAFLISLKTGGTGLNLTAADYVFLLESVVEPRRRGAGRRPGASHWANQAGDRLPFAHQGHGGVQGGRPARAKAGPGRRVVRRRHGLCRETDARRLRVPPALSFRYRGCSMRWLSTVVPLVTLLLVAYLVFVVGAPRPLLSMRLSGGPTDSLARFTGVLELQSSDGRLPRDLEISARALSGQVARATSTVDADGRSELELDFAGPPLAFDLSVADAGRELGHAKVELRRERWLGKATRRGGFFGVSQGDLALSVAAARGVFAVPFPGKLLVRVQRGGEPVAGAQLTLQVEGASPSSLRGTSDAQGLASFELTPREHVVTLTLRAEAQASSGTLSVSLPMAPGAMLAERRGDSLTLRSPIPETSAYVTLLSEAGRLRSQRVALQASGDASVSEPISLAGLPSGPLWARVENEPGGAGAAVVGWPLFESEPVPAKTLDVRDPWLFDTAQSAHDHERTRRRQVLGWSLVVGLLGAFVSIGVVLARAQKTGRALEAHLASQLGEGSVQSVAPRPRTRSLVYMVLIALGFLLLAAVFAVRLGNG
ncbi:MAG: DEAD/DEAH box helicase [Polyangiaceae bacterium]